MSRECSNCRRPMQALVLSAHYGAQVEVDTCGHCCLIWFDGTETARLAAPGVADLIGVIHAAMSGGDIHPHAASLARVQACPVCGAQLKAVQNVSRYGRTTLLQCPQRHGYYQTYILYLAEKGFVRPLAWADIAGLTARGRELFCASCGASMPARPHDACPWCRSAVGVIDPARLASAIDPHGLVDAGVAAAPAASVGAEGGAQPAAAGAAPAAAGPQSAATATATAVKAGVQAHCDACGGPVDLSRDIHCTACHAPVRRSTEAAAQAVSAVDAAIRANYARQHPKVTRARLRELEASMPPRRADKPDLPEEEQEVPPHIAWPFLVFAVVLIWWLL